MSAPNSERREARAAHGSSDCKECLKTMMHLCKSSFVECVVVSVEVEVRSQCGSSKLAPGLDFPRNVPAGKSPSHEIALHGNMAVNEKLDVLLSWFYANGGYSHPAISIAYNGESGFHVGTNSSTF